MTRRSSCRSKHLDLGRVEALAQIVLHLHAIVFDPVHAVALEGARGIGPGLFAKTPAQQNGDRLPENLALDVPQGDVDAGQGRCREAALSLIAQGVVERRPYPFGFQRILAEQPGRVGFDDGGIRQGRAQAFAPSGSAVIADDFDEEMHSPVETHRGAFERCRQPTVEEVSLDALDFQHLCSFPIRNVGMMSAKIRRPSRMVLENNIEAIHGVLTSLFFEVHRILEDISYRALNEQHLSILRMGWMIAGSVSIVS